MGCGASAQPNGSSNPASGKTASGKKKGGKYVDAGSVETLILGKSPPIKLLKASFLLMRAKQALGTRQQLEADEPTAFPDDEMLKRCIGEVWKTAQDEEATHCMYPGIVAFSYRWKTKEHPDPDGEYLAQLQGALRWYMANRAARDLEPDFLVFIDYYCLYQGERTAEQEKLFTKALESMDVVYAHCGIMVWVLSEFQEAKGWMGAAARGPYYDRGWPTFERLVASLCKGPCHCLDMGKFKGRDELQVQSVNAFQALSKEDMARLADPTGPQGEHYADEGFLATLVKGVREAPMTPEDFSTLIKEKAFSVQSDEETVAKLHKTFAETVLGSMETGSYHKIKWEPRQLKSMGAALRLCHKLKSLALGGCSMNETGLAAFASALPPNAAPALETLVLSDNELDGDQGWKALGEALQRGALPKLRSLELAECRMTTRGLAALAAALQEDAAPALQTMVLSDNELEGEEGWKALGEALQRGALPKLRSPDLKQCGMTGVGLQAFASALQANAAPALETLALSFNEIEGDQGWTALGEALQRGALPKLRSLLLEWCGMSGAGLAAFASALQANAAPALETLDVVGNEVEGGEGWKALGDAFSRGALPKLQRLLTAGLVGEESKETLKAAVGRDVNIT